MVTGPAEVVVIGGTNADIKSRSRRAIVAATSNPGVITVRAGGVGRNVAESLARLGVRTALVSAVGDDAFGHMVLDHTRAAGVICDHVGVVTDATTGAYNAVVDEHGALHVAVADTRVLDAVGPDVVNIHADIISSAKWLVLEGNLRPDTLAAALDLARAHRVAVAIDPVSVAKAHRLGAVLQPDRPVMLLTPNRDELAALTDGQGDEGTIREATRVLHRRGVALVWVRDGAHGSWLCGVDTEPVHLPTQRRRAVVDVTGAGDAALAGFLWAALAGNDVLDAARYGTAAALCTLDADSSADEHLSATRLTAVFRTLRGQP
jgi:pseudouridine kinase